MTDWNIRIKGYIPPELWWRVNDYQRLRTVIGSDTCNNGIMYDSVSDDFRREISRMGAIGCSSSHCIDMNFTV